MIVKNETLQNSRTSKSSNGECYRVSKTSKIQLRKARISMKCSFYSYLNSRQEVVLLFFRFIFFTSPTNLPISNTMKDSDLTTRLFIYGRGLNTFNTSPSTINRGHIALPQLTHMIEVLTLKFQSRYLSMH